MFKIGLGYDIHRFAEGRKLILGGVHIPCEYGLLGHSDADVLSHAIADALLGACGLPDIGHYFPNDDPDHAPVNYWRPFAFLFITNWIHDLYQATPFDLSTLRKQD